MNANGTNSTRVLPELASANRSFSSPFWAPDGTMILVSERVGSGTAVWIINPDGTMVPSTGPRFGDTDASWMPDGQHILFVRDGDIHSIALTGGPSTRITQDPYPDFQPRASPDGRFIAWISVHNGVRILVAKESNNYHHIIAQTSDILDPFWSPDSTRIGFTSTLNGGRTLWTSTLVSPNYQPVRAPLPLNGNASQGSWSIGAAPAPTPALSGQIAFLFGTQQGRLGIMNADGTNRHIVSDSLYNVREPHISPDGSRIIFHSYGNQVQGIGVINSDGRGLRNVGYNGYRPRFLGDNNRFLFERYDSTLARTVYLLGSLDGAPESLAPVPASARNVAASPDGKQFVYMDASYALWIVGFDGTNPRQLVPATAGIFRFRPSFSPDGARVLFEQIFQSNDNNASLILVNTDGSDLRQIPTGLPSNRVASFSPDGTHVCFEARDATFVTSAYRCRLDGTELTRIYSGPNLGEALPSWGGAAIAPPPTSLGAAKTFAPKRTSSAPSS